MELESAISLLVQVPIVGIFVWFVLRNAKEWRSWMAEQAKERDKALEHVTGDLKKLTSELKTLTHSIEILTRIVLYHDATVRGTNPNVSGDTKEMIEKVLETMHTEG